MRAQVGKGIIKDWIKLYGLSSSRVAPYVKRGGYWQVRDFSVLICAGMKQEQEADKKNWLRELT
jgi:hypothetical protein